MVKDVTQHGSARAAEQKRRAADRARAYRLRKKVRGVPLARAIDEAVAEAVAFHIAKGGGVNIAGKMLLKTARLILERDGYDPEKAAVAVAARMVLTRDEFSWPDRFPTLKPGKAEHFRETEAGGWTTPLPTVLKHMASI
ncbi:hypothetical protein [Devosia sp. MC521]|uniref:hypothetical protein n=1 Tax=Devosia sp. MC521 TaxID=2759954 RepID=UPI0015FD26FE|nr:hypothetical protein [Devosia sp. MC521]MBJ6986054.1 hypothetical protein [Devosia sp. MC521]QMW61424.1 hypothetical protein H4N61_10560 [Devosia sp. MC521]